MVIERQQYQDYILNHLDKHGSIPTSENLIINGHPIVQLDFLGVLNALKSREMIEYESIVIEKWILTKEGKEICEIGSHGARVFNAIPTGSEGISMADLTKLVGDAAKFGQGAAFKAKWITKTKSGNFIRNVESIVDDAQNELKIIQNTGDHPNAKTESSRKTTFYKVVKGVNFSTTIKKEETDVTMEIGEWKTASFKKYNFDAAGSTPKAGHLHPLLKVKDEFKQIFFELGFSEMPANKYVESSFWNFDALFQPQQHPARDAHDTFFLSEPATCSDFPPEYLERVKKVHSEGGYGSLGYNYDWKVEEAQKMILRTHTTAISSNLLYQLAQQKEFTPVKWFSIDRVFRNETLDATHLAEFHQVEGVIADRNVTLGDLIGILDGFFKKLGKKCGINGSIGISNLRFKPAYNPYTEPSMEIFTWHEGLGKYVEIGNSGMFRPEMLRPMGFPEDVRVIAWGLSTERPTMVKNGLNNIRELVGHKLDLEMVARRLDK
ncbi:hypothetical protein HDV02_002627 [Globomyces sp. JEL0801]|nr:hypothetical protein HDV02_002627 [Globomyces sp. JEL0801]